MVECQLVDNYSFEHSTRKITPEGYLRGKAVLGKTGVQTYRQSELPFALQDASLGDRVKIFRPERNISNPEILENIKLKPITIEHPDRSVNSSNHKDLSVGVISETLQTDSGKIIADLLVTDAEAVKLVDGGYDNISLGYNVSIKRQNGEHNGESYQYIEDSPFTTNHVAITRKARAGLNQAKILDSSKGLENMNEKEIKKIVKDTVAVSLKDSMKEIKGLILDSQLDTHKLKDGKTVKLQDSVIKTEDGSEFKLSVDNKHLVSLKDSKTEKVKKADKGSAKLEDSKTEKVVDRGNLVYLKDSKVAHSLEKIETKSTAKIQQGKGKVELNDSKTEATFKDSKGENFADGFYFLKDGKVESVNKTDFNSVAKLEDSAKRAKLEDSLKDIIAEPSKCDFAYLQGVNDAIQIDRTAAKTAKVNIKDSNSKVDLNDADV